MIPFVLWVVQMRLRFNVPAVFENDIDAQSDNNIINVGSIYFQMPGEDEPGDIYPGTWEEIDDNFSGEFFRASGSGAASFGSGQSHLLASHQHMGGGPHHKSGFAAPTTTDTTSGDAADSTPSSFTHTYVRTYGSFGGPVGSETRPTNVTVRVWKRIV